MHEFSATQMVVETALDFAEQKKAKSVSKVKIEVGALSFLSGEQMKFAYGVITKGTILENSELVVVEKRAAFLCPKCGEVGTELPVAIFHCPKCGSDIEITSGKQCIVKSMEMDL